MALASQVKLLRLLQEGEYYPLGCDQPRKSRARILVATNQDLQVKEAQGNFRKDLLYRLSSHRIEIPPLRERKEDLPALLEFFLSAAAESMGKKTPTIPQELISLLATYSFPGNVRELRAMVYDAVSVHQAGVLSMSRFKKGISFTSVNPAEHAATVQDGSKKVHFTDQLPTLKEISQLLIEEALKRAEGNQSLAARLLGVTPQALSKRLK